MKKLSTRHIDMLLEMDIDFWQRSTIEVSAVAKIADVLTQLEPTIAAADKPGVRHISELVTRDLPLTRGVSQEPIPADILFPSTRPKLMLVCDQVLWNTVALQKQNTPEMKILANLLRALRWDALSTTPEALYFSQWHTNSTSGGAWLKNEIERVQPQLVAILSLHAAQLLLPLATASQPLNRQREQKHQHGATPCMVSYTLEQLVRNNAKIKENAWHDWCQAKSWIDNQS
jgi:hypothetical protein